uniref:peptidoglycan-binding protein LysM n=1 Tax=Methylobacterium sp. Leaf118 TaxID=2876562 RepID=UPI001E34B145
MTAEVRRGIVLAVAGLLGGFAMVVALFGTGELLKRNAAVNPSADAPAGADPTGKPQAGGEAPSGTPLAALTTPPQGESAAPIPVRPEPVDAGGAPTFDIVRVEKDGASVIAGRAAPNARVELLRDGLPIATTVADAAGQFAVTPPDLPPGSSEIALSASGPDGKPLRGRESVTVVVAEKRDARPLIALSAPDAPTRVLSQPDAPEASPGKAPVAAMAKSPDGAAPDAAKDKAAPSAPPPQREAAARPEAAPKGGATARDTLPVRIVSVDAQEGGRLDVTGQASPDSTLRLYLNDTMVASGRTGPDGRIAFTIGRGVRAGAYQIRLDAVDPAGGKVKRRAEVAFAYPENLASAGKPAVAIPGAGKPAGEAVAKAPAAAPLASAAAPPTSAAAPSRSGTAPPAAAGSPV